MRGCEQCGGAGRQAAREQQAAGSAAPCGAPAGALVLDPPACARVVHRANSVRLLLSCSSAVLLPELYCLQVRHLPLLPPRHAAGLGLAAGGEGHADTVRRLHSMYCHCTVAVPPPYRCCVRVFCCGAAAASCATCLLLALQVCAGRPQGGGGGREGIAAAGRLPPPPLVGRRLQARLFTQAGAGCCSGLLQRLRPCALPTFPMGLQVALLRRQLFFTPMRVLFLFCTPAQPRAIYK